MKIYCSCCDKVQPVIIDDCLDAKTNERYQDIVCSDCRLVIASGTGIPTSTSLERDRLKQPEQKPLTHPQIHELDWPDDVSFEDILLFVRAIEQAHGIGEKNGLA